MYDDEIGSINGVTNSNDGNAWIFETKEFLDYVTKVNIYNVFASYRKITRYSWCL